jgi:hypothetical protein
MSNPFDLGSSPGSFQRDALEDDDGLLTATSSSVSAILAGPAGGPGVTVSLVGAEVTFAAALRRILPRTVMFTTTVHAASWKTGAGNPIVVVGTYGGKLQTENLLLTLTNGGDIIRGVLPYDDPTQCTFAIPGQNDALAQFKIGVSALVAPKGKSFRGFRVFVDGDVYYADQNGTIEIVSSLAGVREDILADSIDRRTTGKIAVYL